MGFYPPLYVSIHWYGMASPLSNLSYNHTFTRSFTPPPPYSDAVHLLLCFLRVKAKSVPVRLIPFTVSNELLNHFILQIIFLINRIFKNILQQYTSVFRLRYVRIFYPP